VNGQPLRTLDEEIARALEQSLASGELHHAPSFGKPLQLSDGYDETPLELRMGFKILKDAGVVPAEVEWMRGIDALRRQRDACTDESEREALNRCLSQMQQQLALRLERLRTNPSL
jgi:hypothetical protein